MNSEHSTALPEAVKYNIEECVQCLISSTVDINLELTVRTINSIIIHLHNDKDAKFSLVSSRPHTQFALKQGANTRSGMYKDTVKMELVLNIIESAMME